MRLRSESNVCFRWLRLIAGMAPMWGAVACGTSDTVVPLKTTDTTTDTSTCPALPPVSGSSCSHPGRRCTYKDEGCSDHLCSDARTWTTRTYDCEAESADAGSTTKASDAGSAVDAGNARDARSVVSSASCETYSLMSCPLDQCAVTCCPGGGGPGEGCAGCCASKMCEDFKAENCPIDRCQLVPTCAGTQICTNRFSGSPPSCGIVGYYGASAPCCSGLSSRCGAPTSGGSCDPGSALQFPMCLDCGDGTCETPLETHCNCPEDCR
jgi:hypothetical protein